MILNLELIVIIILNSFQILQKVGAYYSTKIYEFRMKCHLCTNYFTIKTDPQNLDYVVESGARRQNKRWNEADNEQTVITDDKDKQDKLASNSMFKLEHLAEDKNKLLRLVPTLERLEDFQGIFYKFYIFKVLKINSFYLII